MRNTLLLLSLALVSCATPRPEPHDSSAVAGSSASGGERAVGTVRVVGSAPVNIQVVLEPREGGKGIALVGPLRDELRQLSGAEVEVMGPTEPTPDPMTSRQLRATDYRILSIDGEPVITGTVEGQINQWTVLRTPEGDTVYLAGAPPQVAPGQKVWVQGPRGVIVQSYGVLKK